MSGTSGTSGMSGMSGTDASDGTGVGGTAGAPVARRLWTMFEPVHAVTYFTPEARAAYEEANLRGYWRGYFAGRVAPLGPVGAAPVTAWFFTFAPGMVARALPDVWTRATPERVLAAREAGAVAALRRLLPPGVPVARVADALERAVEAAEFAGRPLAAANAALAAPADPVARLWRAATVLREHRGDGHMAPLVATGLDGCAVLVWRAVLDLRRDDLQPYRGWSDEEWAAARERLVGYGWLTADGVPTGAGRRTFADVEAVTDRAAASAWRWLDERGADELEGMLRPIAEAAAGAVPYPNPMGVPRPEPAAAPGA